MQLNKKAIDGYSRGAIESEMDYASPHRIIQLLLSGAMEKVATAKGCIERGDIAEKGRQISWGISIINGLKSSLDIKNGEEISENLDALYEYMIKRLLKAHMESDPNILDEVTALLSEIKAGWDNIPPESHQR